MFLAYSLDKYGTYLRSLNTKIIWVLPWIQVDICELVPKGVPMISCSQERDWWRGRTWVHNHLNLELSPSKFVINLNKLPQSVQKILHSKEWGRWADMWTSWKHKIPHHVHSFEKLDSESSWLMDTKICKINLKNGILYVVRFKN